MPARSGTSSSSMHTATSLGSSFIESSPSRQSPSRNVGRPHRASLVRDPYESPSRQMAIEFNMRLSLSDRDFNEKLDQAAAERAKLHAAQLARAAQEHERVVRCAELEFQRIRLEEEHRKIQHEAAQRRELERLQNEKAREEAEAHRRALEAKQREEQAARQRAEHQRSIQEAEARLNAQKAQEAAAERQKKEQEEANRRAAEAAEKARAAQPPQQALQQAPQQAPQPTPIAAPKTSSSAQAPQGDADKVHAKYLELHLRMKHFRNAFWTEHKKPTSPLKQPVGDARRALRTRLGQINLERKDSIAAIKRLRQECFDMAMSTPGPMIDIRPYLISQNIPQLANEREAAYPAFLLYVWICFEKFLLKQFEKEAANEDGRVIQEVGLIAASLLGDQKYMWKGLPLTDIVLAKLHRACPPLFGIRGTMNTVEGRIRLGYMPNLTADSYNQRLRGIGAGFASMSLRTFSAKAPAIPISEYWRAIVSICNTPPDHLWPGHFALLNGLIRDYYKKFVAFYGVMAKGVLRRATIDLPARAPERCKAAAGTVSALPEAWKKEHFFLE